MAIVSIKWASLLDPNKQPSLQDATGAAPVVPTPTFTSATTSSYTAAITGFDAQFTYTVSASVGSAVRTGGNVTVSGLSANQSSTLTVTAANTARELSFSASAAFLSLPATPTLTQTGQTVSSVTVTIENFDAGLTYTIGSSAGSATRSGNLITVTGLSEGQTITVTATASNTSGNSAQGSVSATSQILGDYESIATVTVGSGGAATIDFTSIPQTYAHLQIRFVSRGLATATDVLPSFRVNFSAPPAGSVHGIRGNGTSNSAESIAFSDPYFARTSANNALGSVFGSHVIDLYDYSSTTKRKTVRAIGGHDRSDAGWIGAYSGVLATTSQITSIRLFPFANNWAQYTTAALYGIKE